MNTPDDPITTARIRCYGSTLFITEQPGGDLLIADGPFALRVPAASREALANVLVDPLLVEPVVRIGTALAWVNVAALTRVRSLICGTFFFAVDAYGAERVAKLLIEGVNA